LVSNDLGAIEVVIIITVVVVIIIINKFKGVGVRLQHT